MADVQVDSDHHNFVFLCNKPKPCMQVVRTTENGRFVIPPTDIEEMNGDL